ncbi:MAG: acetate--CoA ligase family protein [Candidatus Aenigmatarchaeota archaeon]|nr:acetate--CoA ligase family protein [Candidatus Aenigmarchaeota archaeon]
MRVLLGKDAEKFLKGLPLAKSFLIKNLRELIKIKKYPVVMKLISPRAIHKTEVGGVKIVDNLQEAQETFNQFVKLAKTKRMKLIGILIQEYVKGREFIIGIKKDPTFGHVIMFGAGGIFVEALKDVTFRVCPISKEDAESMLYDLKNQWLLSGTRGEKPVNTKLLKQILVKVSRLPQKYKNIEELDINPLMVSEKSVKIVDVRILMK